MSTDIANFFEPAYVPGTAEVVSIESKSPKAQKRQQRKAEKETRQRTRDPRGFQPRTRNQALYRTSLLSNELTYGVGPAGVGKTYVPACVFGEMLLRGDIEKLYLARPNVAKTKHKNGYLPGTLEDKTDPWLVPIYDGLKETMGTQQFGEARQTGSIEVVPYEFIQGRTFKNAACIVDEAENLDLDDLYITLTRQGENLHMCLCGDINQSRIHDSGLSTVVEMVEMFGLESVGVIEFGSEDVVRSRQAKQWVLAFERYKSLQSVTNRGSFDNNPDTLPQFLKG